MFRRDVDVYSGPMWRVLRMAILLLVLVLVGGGTVLDRWRTTDWDSPLRVGIFPIDADGRRVTSDYVDALGIERFADIEEFFHREARGFGLAIERPVDLTLYPAIDEEPPLIEPGAGPLATMLWSLKLRWYNWRIASDSGEQIRLYVLYHDPTITQSVPHSLGLQKGLVGVVYAYATRQMDGQNNIVIAHELLHTLGATDKYDLETNLPTFPDGHGDPQAEPLYPQDAAELMAGRRLLSEDEAEMPASLEGVVIGATTAAEINWVER
jgi:hypothetical protein